jgi:hypothetical protein
VFALAVLGVLSVLTGAWLRLVVAERDAARLDGDALQARSLAHAGIERVLAWFADPASFAETFTAESSTTCLAVVNASEVFRKRCVDADGLPSFRASDGAPQFGGTLERPAVLVQWENAAALLGAPAMVSIDPPRAFPLVRLELRLFAPGSPDVAATVVSRATVDRSTVAVRAELADGPWRGATQAVFAGDVRSNAIPVRVHWGGIAVDGAWDASGWLDRIPRRSETAPVNGEAYAAEPGSDRWAAIAASGSIMGPAMDATGFAAPFAHLRQHADVPRIGLWGYEALKAYAKRHGRYFTTRGTGLLYPDDAETGVSPTSVLAAHSGSRRFLFIDTMDRTAPRQDNLDVLQSTIDFVTLDAYVGAHLTILPGHGRSVVLDAPSAPDTSAGPPLARDVRIEGAHYRGVLVVAGVLEAQARTRIVGSLAALQGVHNAGAFEVWYDAALRKGYRTGFSPVVIKPGSRRAIVDVLG